MVSLTSFLPKLVPYFGISTAAIYERQRALVRLGLLPQPQGRGRGAGAQATPETAALICLSMLATENLSEMDARIIRLACAPIDQSYYKRKYCRLTRTTELKDALSAIIGNASLAERVFSVHVDRKRLEATIHWAKPGHTRRDNELKFMDLSKFAHREPYLQIPLAVEATLDGSAFVEIATAISGSGA